MSNVEASEPVLKRGFQTLDQAGLSQRTELLFLAGLGRSKRPWVLCSVQKIDSQDPEDCAYGGPGSGTLFVLALTILSLACRSMLVRARTYCRARLRPFCKVRPS